jgi:hypothetical protein
MDVHVGEMSSTVRATDSQSLLTPSVLRQIVEAVMAELQVAKATDQQRASERKLQAGSVAQPFPWGT